MCLCCLVFCDFNYVLDSNIRLSYTLCRQNDNDNAEIESELTRLLGSGKRATWMRNYDDDDEDDDDLPEHSKRKLVRKTFIVCVD